MTAGGRPRRRDGPTLEERAFHRWLARRLPSGSSGALPLGDDAAEVELERGEVAVVTTDALVEGTHFVARSPPAAVGRAASAVSLSDVAAKGARPVGVFLAVVAPRGTPQRWAEQLVLGAEREAARFGGHVLGGDTKPGSFHAVISTVVGAVPAGQAVGRTGARPGEALVTTGVVGRGGAAARGLLRGEAARGRAVVALLRLTPRVREGVALRPFASAMLDTSDGIAESAHLLAAASRVRVVVREPAVPWAPGVRHLRLPAERRSAGFYGGDYELLASVPSGRVDAATRAVRAVGGRLTVVGAIEPGSGAVLETERGRRAMPRGSWRPFGRTMP